MRGQKLDKIDKNILKILQDSGRITNVDLAKKVGISAPPCLRRVRALEDAGLIKSYHAHIDAAILGFGVTVFAMVRLDNHAESNLQEFEKHVGGLPMVRESYMLAGDVDFMLKVVAKDWDEYQSFLTRELTSTPNVASVKSSLSVKATKIKPGVPIEE